MEREGQKRTADKENDGKHKNLGGSWNDLKD